MNIFEGERVIATILIHSAEMFINVNHKGWVPILLPGLYEVLLCLQ